MTDADHSLRFYCELFIENMEVRHYTAETLSIRRFDLNIFFTWCEERSMPDADDITRPVIDRYQRYIFNYRQKQNGKALSISSQRGRLTSVRLYFKWLAQKYYVLHNPASEMVLPREGHKLPGDILTKDEVELILIQPDIETPSGLRDRAMMEILYSTGMRRSEVTAITFPDVDFSRRVIMIREGKGRKDRVVPVGQRALDWLQKYLDEGRPKLCRTLDAVHIFFAKNGVYFSKENLTDKVRKYIIKSGVKKKGSCHLFRHTAATLMLENGADIRFIQQMLGHASLETTQVYTRVSITKLRQVHEMTHPSSQKSENPQKSDPDSSSSEPPAFS